MSSMGKIKPWQNLLITMIVMRIISVGKYFCMNKCLVCLAKVKFRHVWYLCRCEKIFDNLKRRTEATFQSCHCKFTTIQTTIYTL